MLLRYGRAILSQRPILEKDLLLVRVHGPKRNVIEAKKRRRAVDPGHDRVCWISKFS